MPVDNPSANIIFFGEPSSENRALQSAIVEQGYAIQYFSNFDEALRAFDFQPYQLMVLDTQLFDPRTVDQLEVFRLSWPLVPLVFLLDEHPFQGIDEIKGPYATVYKADAHKLNRLLDLLSFFSKHKAPFSPGDLGDDFSDIGFFERRLQGLLHIFQTKHQHADPQAAIYRHILSELALLASAKGGSLFVFHKGSLILKATLDKGHVPDSLALPLRPNSPFETATKQAKPLLIKDIRGNKSLTHSGWQGYNDGSLMVIPLMDASLNILSLVSLHNKTRPPFNERDLQLTRLYASIASNLLSHPHQTVLNETPQEILPISIPLVLFDMEGNIHDANDSFASLLDLSLDACLSQNYWSLTLPLYRIPEKTLLYELRYLNRPTLYFEKAFQNGKGDTVMAHLRYSFLQKKESGRCFLASVQPMNS